VAGFCFLRPSCPPLFCIYGRDNLSVCQEKSLKSFKSSAVIAECPRVAVLPIELGYLSVCYCREPASSISVIVRLTLTGPPVIFLQRPHPTWQWGKVFARTDECETAEDEAPVVLTAGAFRFYTSSAEYAAFPVEKSAFST
jgi:hypothetical protein